MLHATEDLTRQVDEALFAAGLVAQAGSFVQRRYQGMLGPRGVRAELSVLAPSQLIQLGYVLTLEVELGLPARLIVGREVPLLLGRGLPVCGEVLGCPLRCHDVAWGRRLVEVPAQGALATLLSEVSWLEVLPSGLLRMQLQRPGRPVVPDMRPLLHALAVLVSVMLAPPGPAPAPARLSDHRGWMVGLVALVVLGLVGAAIVGVRLLG